MLSGWSLIILVFRASSLCRFLKEGPQDVFDTFCQFVGFKHLDACSNTSVSCEVHHDAKRPTLSSKVSLRAPGGQLRMRMRLSGRALIPNGTGLRAEHKDFIHWVRESEVVRGKRSEQDIPCSIHHPYLPK